MAFGQGQSLPLRRHRISAKWVALNVKRGMVFRVGHIAYNPHVNQFTGSGMAQKQLRLRFQFHVARAARDEYQFDQSIFETDGNVVFANFEEARQFANAINANRAADNRVRPGLINAMGLIDEVLHMLMTQYREQVLPGVLSQAANAIAGKIGAEAYDALLREFCALFPPVEVYQGQLTLAEYLYNQTNQENTLEEILMLWLANANPAFKPFAELFDDRVLLRDTAYPIAIETFKSFLTAQPNFPGENKNVFDLLREPALAHPDSLDEQLEYIAQRYEQVSGGMSVRIRRLSTRMLIGRDLIREEQRDLVFPAGGFVDFTPAKGSIPVPDFRAQFQQGSNSEGVGGQLALHEYEAFTPDKDWMPRCILIAKNAYVWLDQLSKKYQRAINTLADIPNAELDFLREAGVTGLWLIGLWERSAASKRIKQIMGQEDAVASAYSLMDYTIAHDLGGDEACNNLKARAWQRGIRLASDMVPNHFGIDSTWVMNYPDRFLQLNYPPYPTYTFNGPNLSNDSRVAVYLEDHYYDKSDAAVVFKRVDTWSGDTRYIYHGNDGTSMPWNDTAQLDYLKAEVREAVIQTILQVARQFPIIRFDAAMTLAKKHVKRLWFPQPGSGEGIASRAAFGMSVEDFEAAMPQEFWREVVDRAAVEAPDTLLLAEAFWLMEGYFVRTLGMHRVYNSAFMHMLRDEDNAKYRQLIKNTIEFDTEILKRYVNFMNNPDEKTAVEQFGKGDKYFGVSMVLATIPGLPMLGHGQIEGFAEKYGMEFRRAKWDERPDEGLISEHRRRIFPLLHKRYLFAEVNHFLLYDFFEASGAVNEDVIAYSNGTDGERALILYHNRFATAKGWLRSSAAYLDKGSNALVQKHIGEGLRLSGEADKWVILPDMLNGLEYLRNSRELVEQGLYVELNAYDGHAFIGVYEVQESNGNYARLAELLAGQGVPSIATALQELEVAPLQPALHALFDGALLGQLLDSILPPSEEEVTEAAEETQADEVAAQPSTQDTTEAKEPAEVEDTALSNDELDAQLTTRLSEWLQAVGDFIEPKTKLEIDEIVGATLADVAAVRTLAQTIPTTQDKEKPTADAPKKRLTPTQMRRARAEQYQREQMSADRQLWLSLLGWALTRQTALALAEVESAPRSWMGDWLVDKRLAEGLNEVEGDGWLAVQLAHLVALLATHKQLPEDAKWQDAEAAQRWLRVNHFQGVRYFNKEAYEQWVARRFLTEVLTLPTGVRNRDKAFLNASYEVEQALLAMEQSGYDLDKLSNATTQ